MLFTILIIAALVLSIVSMTNAPNRDKLIAVAVLLIGLALLLSKYGASLA